MEGNPPRPQRVQRSAVAQVCSRYREKFGRKPSWKVNTGERKQFVGELNREGLGTARYLERVLVILDLPDEALILHELRVLGFEQLERLNRVVTRRQRAIMKQLQAGAKAEDFEELRRPPISEETALRQILQLTVRRLPILERAKIRLYPSEIEQLERAILGLKRLKRLTCPPSTSPQFG